MNLDELLKLNSEGIFPGPNETEEAFVARAHRLKEKKIQMPGDISWEQTFPKLKQLFDFEPRYFSAFYSNKNLRPWEGAAVWIEDQQITSIQLRRPLKKGSFWGYLEKDILAHEAVHAFRSGFQEPKFEEYFAYMVFDSRWKRYFGPLLQQPWEIWPFLGSLALSLLTPFALIFSFAYLFLGLIRLRKRHAQLKKALQKIPDQTKSLALLIRLKDNEIQRLNAGMDLHNCCQEPHTLRWKIIQLAYLM